MMKMKNKIVVLAMGLLAATAAVAEYQYLYWMVDLTDEEKNPHEVASFSYATVKQEGASSYLYFYNTDGEAISSEMLANSGGQKAGPLHAGFDADVTSGNFVFQLWKDIEVGKSELVGWANYSYADLADSIYKTGEMGSGNTAFSIDVIPEPTSALLILVGTGLIALRRKKKSAMTINFRR